MLNGQKIICLPKKKITRSNIKSLRGAQSKKPKARTSFKAILIRISFLKRRIDISKT